MSFFKDVSFSGAGGDVVRYLFAKREHNFVLWLAACIPPLLIVATFYFDAIAKSTPPPPGVFYIESWPLSRSMEDVKRDAAIRGAKKRKMLEERREGYKALGRASGMDVDKIEREGKARKKAAEQAEAKAAAQTAIGASK